MHDYRSSRLLLLVAHKDGYAVIARYLTNMELALFFDTCRDYKLKHTKHANAYL